MKNKFISIITIAILTIILGLSSVYAADPVCSLKFTTTPNNPNPGDEITIVVSTTAINEAITSLGFSMEYDSSVVEVTSSEAASGWTLTKIENFFNITTSNYEGTTKVGNIATIKLKMKDNATTGKTSTLNFKSIEVAKDDTTTVKLDDVTENITITQKQEDTKKDDEKEEQKQEETQKPDDSKKDEQKQEEIQKPDDSKQEEQKQEEIQKPTSSKEEENKQQDNSKQSTSVSDKQIKTITASSDTTQKSGTLPKTGGRNIIFIGAIAVLSVIAAVSYKIYKRNNI